MDLHGTEEKSTSLQPPMGLEHLTQALPHLLWIADENGKIQWWSDRWELSTGKSEAEMLLEGWRAVVHPDHWLRVEKDLVESIQQGKDWEDSLLITDGKGGWCWYLSKAVPARDASGHIEQWIGTHTDVTNHRKREEELKQRHESVEASYRVKADLLVNMSREIRTSMNTILGFASLLKDGSLSDNDREQLNEKIVTSGDQLLQMIDDILNLSKFEDSPTAVEKVRFNISDMVFDVVQAMKPVAEKKDVKVQVFFNTAVPQQITSDPHRIRQIITHLIGNSVKYTEGGGRILIFLSHEAHKSLGSSVRIDVEDTGVGIPLEQQGKLFQPFAQLNSPLNRGASGSRLGLALSERMATSLGGNLSLRGSEIGQGTCFSLLIPTGDISDVSMIKGKKVEPFALKFLSQFRKSKRLEDIKVLLAEDSEDNETLVRLYLKKEGAQVTCAHNGLEALDLIRSEDFDIVLMDIQMPLMDGLEATRQLRQKGFQKPILALTAHALKGDVEKSLKAGCDTHLTKPIQGEALIQEIQKRVLH
jgi:PAS domain S-box-containing protein